VAKKLLVHDNASYESELLCIQRKQALRGLDKVRDPFVKASGQTYALTFAEN
jgi:hypothetical protein